MKVNYEMNEWEYLNLWMTSYRRFFFIIIHHSHKLNHLHSFINSASSFSVTYLPGFSSYTHSCPIILFFVQQSFSFTLHSFTYTQSFKISSFIFIHTWYSGGAPCANRCLLNMSTAVSNTAGFTPLSALAPSQVLAMALVCPPHPSAITRASPYAPGFGWIHYQHHNGIGGESTRRLFSVLTFICYASGTCHTVADIFSTTIYIRKYQTSLRYPIVVWLSYLQISADYR